MEKPSEINNDGSLDSGQKLSEKLTLTTPRSPQGSQTGTGDQAPLH